MIEPFGTLSVLSFAVGAGMLVAKPLMVRPEIYNPVINKICNPLGTLLVVVGIFGFIGSFE